MKPTLRQILLLGLAIAVAVALVPAGLVLDRSLEARLEASARADLKRAPMVLEDRNAARADALMMHAREVAATPGLAAALLSDSTTAHGLVAGRPAEGELPVLVTPAGAPLVGAPPGPVMLEATQRGESPVDFVRHGGSLFAVSVAPVLVDGEWRGAAGVAIPVDAATAGTLAGLTASDVVITAGDTVVATTVEPELARSLAGSVPGPGGGVREVEVAGRSYWATASPLGEVGRVIFAVDVARELAILPELRRGALLAGALALVLALVLGAVVATGVSRPVRGLARAADRLAQGDFDAPLAPSRVEEVDRMARAFADMRSALRSRLAELSAANEELAERQARLQALQSELIRRDRLAATGRLVAELAHEIRNPVANIRNLLEVLHRRLEGDEAGREFADLAIDELLRMHELAEQMLDMNRPMDPGAARADAGTVVDQVAALFGAGDDAWTLETEVEAVPDVAIGPDTLKQVLLSLAQNAREAMPDGGRVRVTLERAGDRAVLEVADEGPGIDEDVMDRIFDPFFTTKGGVSGVGLGLFIAQGLVTRAGGRLTAHNAEAGGAVFRLELPLAGRPEPHYSREVSQ
ncbi:MAG: HAMP domain-containing sensor histidine kinase [Longimicrobiales bacterium]|nr:HAMP domain-containing sensor histidine kinase [Longimicrobiales bacterium]